MNQSGFSYADLKNQSIIDADSLIIGILNLPNLDANSVAIIDGSNDLSDVVLNNGQLLIGRTSNTPIANTLTGTADEVNVTNGSGSITLSLPQPIAPTSSPTFDNITVSHINGKIANDLVTGPSSATNNDLCSFDLATGKVIKDSGIISSNVVTNSGSGVSGNIPSFSSSKVIQDSGIAASTLSGGPFLPLTGGTLSGNLNMGTNSISNVTSLNSKTVNDIVTNSGSSVNGNVAQFSGTSGEIINDSAISSSNLVLNTGGAVVNNDLVVFNGTTGRLVSDSSVLLSNVVQNTSGTVTGGQFAIFSGTSGRLITSSGSSPTGFLPVSGGTMSGGINMGTNSITNIGSQTFSGINPGTTGTIVDFGATYTRGNYIRLGGGGRNIGVFQNGPLFLTNNADFNRNTNQFVYNSNDAATLIKLGGSSSGGQLQYGAVGATGANITVNDALSWNTSGAVTIPTSLNIQSTAGLIGTTTNNNADAGSVGEVIQSTVLSSSPINLTSSANAAITGRLGCFRKYINSSHRFNKYEFNWWMD